VAVHSRHDYNAVDDSQRTVQPMTQHLGFRLVEDSPLPETGKRWVVVAPDGSGCGLRSRTRGGALRHRGGLQ
jgi:catechol 2,3-dioxygenase-like lactoylglutathione lyase family enzyme